MAASYPGSVKTFATRATGQTIDPSHVNDLQDEVNAIEAGLLNGTAPLNSSRSTLVALSVSGNSTLASSITLGTIPYVFPSSGGSTGTVLTCVSTSGSTMSLEWRASTPSPVEAWGRVSSAGVIAASRNVSTVTQAGFFHQVTFSSNLASSNYAVMVTIAVSTFIGGQPATVSLQASSGFQIGSTRAYSFMVVGG